MTRTGRRRKRRREVARAAGKCTKCLCNRTWKYAYCRPCLDQANAYNRRRRNLRLRSLLCLDCPRSAGGSNYCSDCRRHRARKRASLRIVRLRAGLCQRCGRKRDGPWLKCRACSAHVRLYARNRAKRIRLKVLARYGSRCACCLEVDHPAFLTIDHIFNDGGIERKEGSNSQQLHERLLKLKSLSRRHQVLCWNCNEAKRIYGQCPHLKERKAPYLRKAS